MQYSNTVPVIDHIESTRSTVRSTILPELLAESWKWVCEGMFLDHGLQGEGLISI